MNSRVENANLDAYVGGEFILYADGDVFCSATQQDKTSPHADRDFKYDLGLVGQLCKILHQLDGHGGMPLPAKALPPLQRRFEIMAQTYPGAYAVKTGNQFVTYAELDAQADALALYLQRHGLVPGSFCLVRLKPSLAQVRVILAILKAGCAYLQIDRALQPKHVAAIKDAFAPSTLFLHATDSIEAEDVAMQIVRCRDADEALPFGWPDEREIGPGTPAGAFATLAPQGGVCMSLRTHYGMCLAQHMAPDDQPLPAAGADAMDFWPVLSAGALLTIPFPT